MADKIAISIDPDLLEQIEALRRETKESRSAVLARAARMLLRTVEKERAIQQYVDAYRRRPEKEKEVAAAEVLARSSLASVEWDE